MNHLIRDLTLSNKHEGGQESGSNFFIDGLESGGTNFQNPNKYK